MTMVAGVAGLAVATAGPASAANTGIALTVTPDTGLANGQSVTVTASGFAATSIGNFLECNSDSGQPTVALPSPVSSSIAVSCTAPSYGHLVTTSASGALSGTFTVVQGTVGPPCGVTGAVITTCPGTDSSGGAPATDAAKYPCPPTAAQQAAGDVCTLTYGDEANDSGTADLNFAGGSPPSSTTTAAPGATTTVAKSPTTTAARTTATTTGATPTTAPATAAASSANTSLATTGPGPQLWLVAIIGFVALYLGSVVLALVDRPRSRLRRLFRMSQPLPASTGPPAMADHSHQPAGVQPPVQFEGAWTAAPDVGAGAVHPQRSVSHAPPVPLVSPRPANAVAPAGRGAVEASTVVPTVGSLYPKADGPQGLWVEGLDPGSRS